MRASRRVSLRASLRAPVAIAATILAAAPAGAASGPSTLHELAAAYRCHILERLHRIHDGDRTTSRDRFIALYPDGRPDAYVQCIFLERDTKLLCEAASGAYRLKAGEAGPATPAGDMGRLRSLGFAPDPAGGNLRRDLALRRPADLGAAADLILAALHDGFGMRWPVKLRVRAPKARAVPASACAALS